MTLNKFSVTADLDYSPESIDSFINICEGLISCITNDSSAKYFLKTAVDELSVNSIQHGYLKKSGKIRVCIERREDKIYLEIADHGIGIDPSAVNINREAQTEEDLQPNGWAMAILNRISNGVSIRSNHPRGAIVSLSINLPFNH
ncbi:MAG: ATP-binding protein [Clostridiaceae bacterium]|jgi:anti-sigma regulatory factor (Ser/Thr protein kinase)|nr:ATP-binding protein [Bacillota bacterium]NLI38991.1 ATP-binding protein [Clostridiaceae bacterium]